MTSDEIETLRVLAKSERWETEAANAPAWMSMALTKQTVLRLLAIAEDHAKLVREFSQLREDVMNACDPECAGCGAWYVAKEHPKR